LYVDVNKKGLSNISMGV